MLPPPLACFAAIPLLLLLPWLLLIRLRATIMIVVIVAITTATPRNVIAQQHSLQPGFFHIYPSRVVVAVIHIVAIAGGCFLCFCFCGVYCSPSLPDPVSAAAS